MLVQYKIVHDFLFLYYLNDNDGTKFEKVYVTDRKENSVVVLPICGCILSTKVK